MRVRGINLFEVGVIGGKAVMLLGDDLVDLGEDQGAPGEITFTPVKRCVEIKLQDVPLDRPSAQGDGVVVMLIGRVLHIAEREFERSYRKVRDVGFAAQEIQRGMLEEIEAAGREQLQEARAQEAARRRERIEAAIHRLTPQERRMLVEEGVLEG